MRISLRCSCAAAFLVFVSLCTADSFADDNPPPPALNDDQVSSLFMVGKVWGYLKYHHPRIVQGCVDWDEKLLSDIPEFVTAGGRQSIELELASWIDELDVPDACTAAQGYLEPRTDWLSTEELLGNDLAERLRAIQNLQQGDGQHYVSQQPGIRNPVFRAEASYANVEDFDWRYRLLALYRIWNIVEYWFPYRDLIDEDWDAVLRDSIPRLYSAGDRQEYLLELARLLARVDDGHADVRESIYVRPPGGRSLPPFSIRMVEARPFVWRRFALVDDDTQLGREHPEDELRFGDVILSVDGRPVEELFEEARPFIGASNEVSRDRVIAQFLLNGQSDTVSISVDRDGEIVNVENRRLPRDSIDIDVQHWHDRDGGAFQLLSNDIAYLKVSNIDKGDVAEHIMAASGTKGLVIDLRSYPSSFVVFALGQHLVTERTPFARFTRGELSRPGSFVWTDVVAVEPAEPNYSGKVVILVDENTMSQAEYTAMAFRAAPDAMVVGSQTAGADGNVSRIPIPGGYNASMSGIGVYYPDKTGTQRVGIVPDLEVRPTINGLRAGRDELLEVAIREILGGEVPDSYVRELAAFSAER